MSRRKTHIEYVDELRVMRPDIDVIGLYIDAKTPIEHQCRICGYIWPTIPDNILHKSGCPVCATPPKAIGPAPIYKNSIWNSELKDFFSRFMTEEQMKTTMPRSEKKIQVCCPDCKTHKTITPSVVSANRSIGCVCSDGLSFANKFVFSVLNQIKIKNITEYSPVWANGKRYDNYLIDYNIIVENHGMQHYEESSGCFKSLKAEQKNDFYKKQLAMENKISKYIVIDCRYSTLEWIMNSIMSSELPHILNFEKSDIDWCLALEYASKNLLKETVELYNQHWTVSQIAQHYGLCVETVRTWLKTATQLHLCDYNPQSNKLQQYKKMCKQVLCVELNKTFDSVRMAAKFVGAKSPSNIALCCRGKLETSSGYHWKYI